jgi:hypothetical protein
LKTETIIRSFHACGILSHTHLHQALQVILTTKQLFSEFVVDALPEDEICGFDGTGALFEDKEAERENEPVQPSTVQEESSTMEVDLPESVQVERERPGVGSTRIGKNAHRDARSGLASEATAELHERFLAIRADREQSGLNRKSGTAARIDKKLERAKAAAAAKASRESKKRGRDASAVSGEKKKRGRPSKALDGGSCAVVTNDKGFKKKGSDAKKVKIVAAGGKASCASKIKGASYGRHEA